MPNVDLKWFLHPMWAMYSFIVSLVAAWIHLISFSLIITIGVLQDYWSSVIILEKLFCWIFYCFYNCKIDKIQNTKKSLYFGKDMDW